jgi:hypothetical protein
LHPPLVLLVVAAVELVLCVLLVHPAIASPKTAAKIAGLVIFSIIRTEHRLAV